MATAPVPPAPGQPSTSVAGTPGAGSQLQGTDAASAPRFPELYAPGAPFAAPELQSLAADGLLARFHQHGYTLPGVPASPKLRAPTASPASRSASPSGVRASAVRRAFTTA